ncbi:Reverse transcriptase domain-containing protein [Balamuthia mandrillaris]
MLDHDILARILRKRGAEEAAVGIITEWYYGMTSVIHMNGQLSKEFLVERGVKQGGLQVAEVKERGDKARNICLLFADDLAVVASDPFELQRRLNVAVEAVNALGLQFNAKKSVVLVQGKKAHFQDTWDCGLKKVGNGQLKERITKAKQALYSLRQRGAIAQGLGTRTAQIAAEAIVKSTLSYGLCMTELSKSWWKKIEAVWNETARSVLQVHRRTVAEVCRAELGWLTIKAYCEL